MAPKYGLNLRPGNGSDRLEMRCEHQNGLLYMVPAEGSWVCRDENRHAHVLAGFFKDVAKLNDPRIREVMNRWGLYYRERPLDEDGSETDPSLR
ncbi:MAG: hypothetical protein HY682_03940 [Chloroflexi bacterium]|nr:hypothetical protein [Chloroflexota bacterium]